MFSTQISAGDRVMAIDFQSGWNQAWNSIATFVPKLAMFLVILLVGWIVASIVARIVRAVLGRVGFDRVVERAGINRMLGSSRYDATNILAKLAKYAIMLITLQGAFNVWGPNAVSDLLKGVIAWLPKAFIAIVMIVVAGAIARVVRDMVTNMLGGLSYGRTLGTIASVFVWAIGIIAALGQIGVATHVTDPLLIAVLFTAAGIAVVGFGGGLIKPMQDRWGNWLNTLERDLPTARRTSGMTMSDAYSESPTMTGEAPPWYQGSAAPTNSMRYE